MKVLLINAESFHIKHKSAIPLGLLSIATYLKENGHTVKLHDRTVENGNIENLLDSFSPDITGIAAPAFKSFSDAIKISKLIKERDIPVVWGGPITSLTPEIVLGSDVVDFVVMGEGEITFLELMNAIAEKRSMQDIDGLAYLDKGEVVINKDRAFADLADLPVIDFSFVDPKKYFVENVGCKKMLHIYASKGCVCQCTYCYNPYISQCVWRPRPSEYYLSEIKYLVENCGMDGVCFADDLLSPNNKYLTDFCNKIIESGIKFIWGGEFRADMCSKENLQLMYDSGCRWIYFGIESGSDERQKKIKKYLNLTKAKQTIEYCREIGIVSSTSFIISFPDETEEELIETIQYMQSLKSDIVLPSFYGPIPKSEMYEELLESKKLEAPQSYKDWEKMKMMDLFGKNYSKVPDLELRVISAYFYFINFLWKYPDEDTHTRVYVRKAVSQTFDVLKRGGFRSLYLIAMSAKEFLEVVFYATMFPKIRKKYGLKKK
ncbi:MAG TPA: radical SAM protein [Clostridia bacterium]|nr:radical SAM protein [Clostridia bacterium]